MAFGSKKQEEKALGQGSLFDMAANDSNQDVQITLDIKAVEDFDSLEKLRYEAQLLGIYVSGHPLDRFQDTIRQFSSMNLSQVQEISGADKREMVLSGLVTNKKMIFTKKGDKMCFAQLEDLSGKMEVIIFPRMLVECEELLNQDGPLMISGSINLAEAPRKLVANKIQKLEDQLDQSVRGVRINLDLEAMNEQKLDRFRQVLLSYRGAVPVHFIVEGPDGKARLNVPEEYAVNPGPQMAAKINDIFQRNSVQFIINGKLEDATGHNQ
jgi:DNA polymerase-3 subunit alpha